MGKEFIRENIYVRENGRLGREASGDAGSIIRPWLEFESKEEKEKKLGRNLLYYVQSKKVWARLPGSF